VDVEVLGVADLGVLDDAVRLEETRGTGSPLDRWAEGTWRCQIQLIERLPPAEERKVVEEEMETKIWKNDVPT